MKPPTELQRGNHCVYELYYHFVFVVKYRRAVISPEVEAELARISHEISARYDFEVLSLGADRDHIHLLCSSVPTRAPSEIVRIYKSIAARQLFRVFPALKKELWGGNFWTAGYYVSTVGRKAGWDELVEYIEDQGQHPEAMNLRFIFQNTEER